MKSAEEIMEILEAYDLTGSLRDAGELSGCSHHTVGRYVAARQAGRLVPGAPTPRPSVIDPYRAKVEELVERSKGKVRADVVHDKLVGMGYPGAPRTTRRAVASAKAGYLSGRRRVFRPWIPEPGMWAQYDFGEGPRIDGAPTVLFCLWLAWSRFRVVLPLLDKAQPTVFAAVDVALRRLGGVPTYLLTDNEKTVTVEHVAGVPVRNPLAVGFGRHYGLTVATCLPADPQTKGGSEATVRIAKADLVPTAANLLGGYGSFTELEAACEAFCGEVNGRPHRATRRPPAQMLAEESDRLHPLPVRPFTVLLGAARRVGTTTAMVSFEGGQYSVPHRLAGQVVRVRRHGDQIVVVHVADGGPVEVARHHTTGPGRPALDEAHFPPVPAGPAARTPKPRSTAEAAFCALGDGARLWLIEAAAAGASRVRVKMTEAVTLAALHGPAQVDRALGVAATAGRFTDGDLVSVLAHQASAGPGDTSQATEQHTLAQGTGGWNALGAEPEAL
ncbi:MAG: IS21 family transposase [Frankia sp.]